MDKTTTTNDPAIEELVKEYKSAEINNINLLTIGLKHLIAELDNVIKIVGNTTDSFVDIELKKTRAKYDYISDKNPELKPIFKDIYNIICDRIMNCHTYGYNPMQTFMIKGEEPADMPTFVPPAGANYFVMYPLTSRRHKELILLNKFLDIIKANNIHNKQLRILLALNELNDLILLYKLSIELDNIWVIIENRDTILVEYFILLNYCPEIRESLNKYLDLINVL